MGKRKEEVWNRKKYPFLFVAFVFIRAELLLNARRILFFSRVSGKRSFVEFRARFPSRRQYARLTLASINQPVERISTIRRRDANDRRYSSGIRRSRVVDGTTFYIFSSVHETANLAAFDRGKWRKLNVSPSSFRRSERSEGEIGRDRDFSRKNRLCRSVVGSGKDGCKVSFKRGKTRRRETGEQVFASFTVT